MISNIFNRISKAILRYRYRRLYCRLFWYYASRSETSAIAIYEANDAFLWITGTEWVDWV
ncbi:MAG: hypothetical protein HDS71_04435 [Bacteroidales bacterium]|nr:hypothetical protein [Bacteroidales bacterium]